MFKSIISLLILFVFGTPILKGAEEKYDSITPVVKPIAPFTGKITRNKVRMRLQPSLDAPILYELARDDLLAVTGELEEFYCVLPPKETKAYVFRTFVLDDIVEGNRVNVRLEPALESPIIGQLNNGDRVQGTVSPLNSKWLEIAPPASTRFYVCKEYVENIGTPAMLAQIERRRTEASALLSSARLMSDVELKKAYREINLDAAIANLNALIKQYTDFPASVEQAKELLSTIQDHYLQKKIEYLEARALQVEKQNEKSSASGAPQNNEMRQVAVATVMTSETENLIAENSDYRESVHFSEPRKMPDWNTPFDTSAMTGKMAAWLPLEQALFESWKASQIGGTPKEFYEQQFSESISLKGTVEPYARSIKNKPGDYLLVSSTTHLPIAYLYSTRVDLEEVVGHDTVLHAVARSNNNFAFPAYYIISVEQ